MENNWLNGGAGDANFTILLFLLYRASNEHHYALLLWIYHLYAFVHFAGSRGPPCPAIRLVNFRFSYALRAELNDNLVRVRVDAHRAHNRTNPICVCCECVSAFLLLLLPFFRHCFASSRRRRFRSGFCCCRCCCCCFCSDFKYDANHYPFQIKRWNFFSIDFPFTHRTQAIRSMYTLYICVYTQYLKQHRTCEVDVKILVDRGQARAAAVVVVVYSWHVRKRMYNVYHYHEVPRDPLQNSLHHHPNDVAFTVAHHCHFGISAFSTRIRFRFYRRPFGVRTSTIQRKLNLIETFN